jgi:membrane fusion protein, macrolide-specific efflux system
VAEVTVDQTIASSRARRKRAKRRKTITIVFIIVVLAVGGYLAYHYLHGSKTAQVVYTTEAAAKVTIIKSISGTGSVNLNSTESVGAEVSGTVETIKVKKGDKVTEGQVLFTMTNDDLQTAIVQANNSYEQAVNTLSSSGLQLEKAQKSLDDLKKKYNAERWEESPEATVGASSLGVAASSDASPLRMASFNVTPPSTTTTTVPRTTSTTTAPSTTNSTISDLDIALAEQQVTSAQLSVQVAQTNVTLAQMSLDDAKDSLTKLEVTAPMAGTITALNIEEGDEIGSSGGSSSGANSSAAGSSSSSSAVVITDLSQWDVTVTLAEADVSSVKTGQNAILAFDALPDVSLTGKVASMDTTGTNSSGVVSYTATILPDVGNEAILGGMTVTVDIVTLAVADVVGVPNAAVKTSNDGSNYVQLLENNAPVDQTVTTGASDDSYTQIKSGLTEGQDVIIATVTPGASTATTARGGGGNSILNGGGAMPGGGAFPAGGASGFGPPPGG